MKRKDVFAIVPLSPETWELVFVQWLCVVFCVMSPENSYQIWYYCNDLFANFPMSSWAQKLFINWPKTYDIFVMILLHSSYVLRHFFRLMSGPMKVDFICFRCSIIVSSFLYILDEPHSPPSSLKIWFSFRIIDLYRIKWQII